MTDPTPVTSRPDPGTERVDAPDTAEEALAKAIDGWFSDGTEDWRLVPMTRDGGLSITTPASWFAAAILAALTGLGWSVERDHYAGENGPQSDCHNRTHRALDDARDERARLRTALLNVTDAWENASEFDLSKSPSYVAARAALGGPDVTD